MRVLIYVTLLSEDGSFGGPTSVARAHARELTAQGHDVTLIGTGSASGSEVHDGFRTRVFRGKSVLPRSFITIWSGELARWLRENGPAFDVAHLHFGRHLADLQTARILRAAGVPTVLQTHGMLPHRPSRIRALFDRLFVSPAILSAQAVLALTEAETRDIRAQWPSIEPVPIRNAVPVVSDVKPRTERDDVVFIARLHPRKRVLAFAASAALSEQEVDHVVYGPDEGDLKALMQFSASHPHARVTYRGPIKPEHVVDVLSRALVLVLPSHGEVFPMTVLEALSVGTPVILTDDCGISEELVQLGASISVDGSPEAIAQALRFLLDSAEEWARFSKAAHDASVNEFSLRTVVEQLVSLYRSAAAKRTSIGG